MNEDNLKRYWSWTHDENLRGTYDTVSERIFSTDRSSEYWQDEDMSEILLTPVNMFDSYAPEKVWDAKTVRILSPRRLDEDLFTDDIPTYVVLDTIFTQEHPRSETRIEFVQQRTKKYDIPFICWSYKEIIDSLREQWKHVIIDERFDPVYRDVQLNYRTTKEVTILPYSMINPTQYDEPIMKFFKYWNKTTKFMKQLTHD